MIPRILNPNVVTVLARVAFLPLLVLAWIMRPGGYLAWFLAVAGFTLLSVTVYVSRQNKKSSPDWTWMGMSLFCLEILGAISLITILVGIYLLTNGRLFPDYPVWQDGLLMIFAGAITSWLSFEGKFQLPQPTIPLKRR